MAVKITQTIKDLFEDPKSRKVLATVDREGNPHAVFKDSLNVTEAGYLTYWELIETSRTNKNMVYSIWFHKPVTVSVTDGTTGYQIKGIPYRSIIAGKEFEKEYRKVQELYGNVDLSAVWLIEPVEIVEETLEKRRTEEEEKHPILRHLDRLVVPENAQK